MMRLFPILTLSALLLAGCASSGGGPALADDANSLSAAEPVERYERLGPDVRGTRFRHSSLSAFPVTIYTREDIRGTSETDALQSLRYLDPRFFPAP